METQISPRRNRGPQLRCILGGFSLATDGICMTRYAPLVLILLLGTSQATASQQGAAAITNWKTMDRCARDAQTAFPDFTAEANAKRDAQLKACLEGRNLPPRDSLAPGR